MKYWLCETETKQMLYRGDTFPEEVRARVKKLGKWSPFTKWIKMSLGHFGKRAVIKDSREISQNQAKRAEELIDGRAQMLQVR